MVGEPLVSAVIPAYNRTDLLKEAVESVLGQTYSNLEIIIIDDGSTEDLLALDCMKDDRIRFFRNENHGVAYSRNFGMEKAKGKYIAFLDSDDIWLPDKIKIQVEAMEREHAQWSQHSYYYYYGSNGARKAINTYRYRKNIKKIQFCSYKVQTSCFMVEREAVKRAHALFDESRTFGEDNEFFYQMSSLYPLLCIDEYLTLFRIKETNAGRDVKKQIESRAFIYEKHGGESEFLINTGKLTRIAYKMCYNFCKKHNSIDSAPVLKLVYALPWLIFKIETKRYCVR